MLVILYPQPLSARTADSRPGPGPLTSTSRFLRPYSFAASPARSAATCAANGVDLREPRKPEPPAVAQLNVFPLTVSNRHDGVVERRVNVRHSIDYLFGNLSLRCLFGLLCHLLPYFYINATNWDVATHEKQLTLLNETYLRIGLRGPLRVRAFVLVR